MTTPENNILPGVSYFGPPGTDPNKDIETYLKSLPVLPYYYQNPDGHLFEKPEPHSDDADGVHSDSCACLIVLPENLEDSTISYTPLDD